MYTRKEVQLLEGRVLPLLSDQGNLAFAVRKDNATSLMGCGAG